MNFKSFDFRNMPTRDSYQLMIQAIVPRPIAFVSTKNNSGLGNLAPFSFFMGVASNPPSLAFSATLKRDGNEKDTIRNIRENGEFVVNIVNEAIGDQMNKTSADFPYGVDEMSEVGLTPLQSLMVSPARVKEAPIQMECKSFNLVQIGDTNQNGSAVLVVGEILFLHVQNSLLSSESLIDPIQLKAIGRMGGAFYTRTTDLLKY